MFSVFNCLITIFGLPSLASISILLTISFYHLPLVLLMWLLWCWWYCWFVSLGVCVIIREPYITLLLVTDTSPSQFCPFIPLANLLQCSCVASAIFNFNPSQSLLSTFFAFLQQVCTDVFWAPKVKTKALYIYARKRKP